MTEPSGARPLAAAAWVGGAVASFSAMTVAGRELAAEFDTFEVMAYRSAIGLPIILVAVLATGGLRSLRTAEPGLHMGRNVIHFAAQNLWFWAVTVIPLAHLTALEFTNPIWVAMLAPFLLGEPLTRAKLLAAALGFAGVLVITRPGGATVELGHIAGLGAALGFALTNMATRRLRADGTLCIVFWMTASQLLMGLACAAPGGIAIPSQGLLPWVALVGLSGLSAHFCLTQALARAPASVVGPMEYARLPVIAVLGMALYGEALELALLLGAGLIVGGNVVNILSARRSAA